MLDEARSAEIADQVARTSTGTAGPVRVITNGTSDLDGKDALRITVVLTPEDAERLTGDEALDLLVSLHQTLQAEGEDRFPFIEYATEAELAEDDLEDAIPQDDLS